MPVAVMAENAFSFKKLLDQCENQELEAPGGIATPPVYGQLLALYLLHNDMNNARYLWKRIPPAIKSANSELGGIWSVGQRIWQRDFPGIYTTIGAHQWSETVQPIMEALREATRRRAFALVSQAYTSIVADDFAAFVGLPVEEAVKGILEQGWQADSTTRMVMPKKPVRKTLLRQGTLCRAAARWAGFIPFVCLLETAEQAFGPRATALSIEAVYRIFRLRHPSSFISHLFNKYFVEFFTCFI
uniref:COP9 signalosome complex subunit 8 n=1 Tax=Molossus molossus TaxID=27622 RepID=A0A7J8FQ89_MOLMO|nr:COP9 signalosome subunit 8 [Molossus molossus]